MHQTVEAIYDNGVLRPLEKLTLRPQQRVRLHIDEVADAAVDLDDKTFQNYCLSEGDPNVSLEEVRRALAVIPGSLTEACSAERDER